MKKTILATVLIILACRLSAHAGWAPLQASFWSPVQILPEEFDVYGLRIDLPYGKNRDVGGIDMGFVNQATRHAVGIQVGVLCNFDCEMRYQQSPRGYRVYQFPESYNHSVQAGGIQLAGLFNLDQGDMTGIQLAPVNIVLADMRGFQVGAVNFASRPMGVQIGVLGNGLFDPTVTDMYMHEVRGIQIGGLWNDAIDMHGLQISALYNHAIEMQGLQIGLINECVRMRGVQLGLLNIIDESVLMLCPIMNACF